MPLTIRHSNIGQILLLLQALTLFRQRRPVKRFNDAFISAAAFLTLIISICWRIISSSSNFSGEDTRIPHLILIVLQLACASVSFLSCLLLARRPCVFFKGLPVDGQYTVSTLNRWTFAWADELLTFAKRNHGLDLVHLPQLHLRLRSEYLEKLFAKEKRSNILWRDLFRVHRLELVGQSLLAMSQGILQFTPQLAMYKLLELLEQRSKGAAVANEAWIWVAALGISIIVTAWVEAFLHWVVWARLGSLIRSELSALIFSKSTRRKDVKGHQKALITANIEANGVTEPAANGPVMQQQTQPDGPIIKPINEEEDEEVQKS